VYHGAWYTAILIALSKFHARIPDGRSFIAYHLPEKYRIALRLEARAKA
jgi:hypothetical protein